MDETRMAEGEIRHGGMAGSGLLGYVAVTEADPSLWASSIECGGTNGQYLMPAVVLTRSSLQGQWFPKDIPYWEYNNSDRG